MFWLWIYNYLCQADVLEHFGPQPRYDVDEVIRRTHDRQVRVHLRDINSAALATSKMIQSAEANRGNRRGVG